MVSFRLKQIGLALCLMVSLLTASPAACTCSHHEETETSENECHLHHEATENVEAAETDSSIDESCICVVDQPSPFVGTKSASKELKSKDPVSNAEQTIPDVEFVAVSTFQRASPEVANDLSYSSTLKSLLPSRAPPRL